MITPRRLAATGLLPILVIYLSILPVAAEALFTTWTHRAAQPMTSDADVCCGPDSMNPAVSFCCGGAVSSMEGLTSDQMLCCDGVAFTNAAGNLACCGQVSFNTETEICCSDVVLPLGTTDPANAYCCGGAVIDMTDYWCCDNNPYPRGSSAAPPIGQNCNI
uniref:Galaxin-like repeats domain-containing protein n=1 Tax=Ciona savignyi TaxID=51511 RepID=H2ZBJ4_CIOSA